MVHHVAVDLPGSGVAADHVDHHGSAGEDEGGADAFAGRLSAVDGGMSECCQTACGHLPAQGCLATALSGCRDPIPSPIRT